MMTEKKIFEKAIATYGENAQKLMLIEEMSELAKEICKDFRGGENYEAIAGEIADVEIMLEQAKMIYDQQYHRTSDFYTIVKDYHKRKVERLEKRLEAAE